MKTRDANKMAISRAFFIQWVGEHIDGIIEVLETVKRNPRVLYVPEIPEQDINNEINAELASRISICPEGFFPVLDIDDILRIKIGDLVDPCPIIRPF